MTQPEAAVAIVHTRSPSDSILLMRRTVREQDSWSGQWSFPGGRTEPADRDPLATALRELAEECGIQLTRDHLERALPARLARRRIGPFVPVSPFVLRVDTELAATPCERETAATRWVPLAFLRDPRQHRLQRVPNMPADTLFPAVDLDGGPLWGFTYRLITDWLGLSSQDPADGLAAAQQVLDLVLAKGLTLEHSWDSGRAQVKGVIPAADVLRQLSAPQRLRVKETAPPVNRLQVRPDSILIAGPQFEEYWIRAAR